jgi:hypothetical protein
MPPITAPRNTGPTDLAPGLHEWEGTLRTFRDGFAEPIHELEDLPGHTLIRAIFYSNGTVLRTLRVEVRP